MTKRRREQADTDALALLWAPPDPALTNRGFAVEPEYLRERLEDARYRARYTRSLGGAVDSDDVADVPGEAGGADADVGLRSVA